MVYRCLLLISVQAFPMGGEAFQNLYKFLRSKRGIRFYMSRIRGDDAPADQAHFDALAHHFFKQPAEYFPKRRFPPLELRDRAMSGTRSSRSKPRYHRSATSVWMRCSICRSGGMPYRKPTNTRALPGRWADGRTFCCKAARLFYTQTTSPTLLADCAKSGSQEPNLLS